MPRPAAVLSVALAVAVASALPLQRGDDSARAQVGSANGPLVATDGSGAVLVAQGLRPGDSRVGEVTVANAGDTSGAFVLSQADRLDSPTPAGPLSGVLDLTVADLTAGRTVFAGKLGALQSVALGTFAQGEAHRYRFVVVFPGGGPPALDNLFQVASTSVSYVWSAGSVQPAPPPAPPAATPPSTLDTTTVSRPAPTARLVAAARQRGRVVRVRLTCQAACRARVGATVRVGRTTVRLRSVSRSLRAPGTRALRLALPRRARAGWSRATARVAARVTIGRQTLLLRKTVKLIAAGNEALMSAAAPTP